MWILLISIFAICYLLIALEHVTKINKSAIALFLAVVLWTIILLFAPQVVSHFNMDAFQSYLIANPSLEGLPFKDQAIRFLTGHLLIKQLGDTSETLFFLLGAMTVVELIDQHGGFNFITQRITTRRMRLLLWTIALISFFLSALLDNLTTSIVMIMLVRKLVPHREIRWWMAGVVIVAANTGGAWSPIGDITTIMLWVKGNITSIPTVVHLFLPSFVAMVVPVLFIHHRLRGMVEAIPITKPDVRFYNQLSLRDRMMVLILGILGLLSVPVLKSITGLPPFMGILFVLSILWIFTEIVYQKVHNIEEHHQNRVSRVISRVDIPTILFFLGILTAVSALQVAGILNYSAQFLDIKIHNTYLIGGTIGVLSSIIDNVPLVAGAIGMYALPSAADIAASADPAYLSQFVQDGAFWQLLAYCAGVGGSILIIGSAAGIVVMGLEKITFTWYLKHFTFIVILGYIAGILTYYALHYVV